MFVVSSRKCELYWRNMKRAYQIIFISALLVIEYLAGHYKRNRNGVPQLG